ncbi:hypothetical protein JN080_26180 [Bacillus sp. EB600]|nr:hypothetical protein [Bacillus sp. EB600]
MTPYFNRISINEITTKMLDDFYNDKLEIQLTGNPYTSM